MPLGPSVHLRNRGSGEERWERIRRDHLTRSLAWPKEGRTSRGVLLPLLVLARARGSLIVGSLGGISASTEHRKEKKLEEYQARFDESRDGGGEANVRRANGWPVLEYCSCGWYHGGSGERRH